MKIDVKRNNRELRQVHLFRVSSFSTHFYVFTISDILNWLISVRGCLVLCDTNISKCLWMNMEVLSWKRYFLLGFRMVFIHLVRLWQSKNWTLKRKIHFWFFFCKIKIVFMDHNYGIGSLKTCLWRDAPKHIDIQET